MASSYTFRNVARMEWIKLRTLRSVRWTLLFALAGMIGIGIAAGFNTRNPRGDVTNNILVGGALGSVLFAVLGVLVMTSEYSSGTIRATLAAIPRHGREARGQHLRQAGPARVGNRQPPGPGRPALPRLLTG
jgi:ABC-2 type transport system permease protein